MRHQHVVIGIQYQQAVRRQRFRHHQLDRGEVVEIVDAVLAEMIGADIGDHRHARIVRHQAASQQAAARGLQHRRGDARIAQHGARADRAGIVAGFHAFAVDEQAVGAAVAGMQAMRTQHRRQQAHRGGLAVGTGDHGFGDAVQARPRHLRRRRQMVQRPCLRTHAFADRQRIVIGMRGQAMRVRGIDQRQQCRLRLVHGQCAELPQRFLVVEVRNMRARHFGFVVHRRIAGVQAKCRVQRPLVDFGGDVELVEGCLERHRRAAGVFAHEHRALRPTQRHTRTGDVVAPALLRRAIERNAGRDLECGTGAIEIQIGTGEAARVLERFAHCIIAHASMLNRFPRARSAARARRAPRLPSPRPVVRQGWSRAPALRHAVRRPACRHPA